MAVLWLVPVWRNYFFSIFLPFILFTLFFYHICAANSLMVHDIVRRLNFVHGRYLSDETGTHIVD